MLAGVDATRTGAGAAARAVDGSGSTSRSMSGAAVAAPRSMPMWQKTAPTATSAPHSAPWRRNPPIGASTSTAVLLVSISATGWPDWTSSPSATSHWTSSTDSSLTCSCGIRTGCMSVAHEAKCGLGDVVRRWDRFSLQRARRGNRVPATTDPSCLLKRRRPQLGELRDDLGAERGETRPSSTTRSRPLASTESKDRLDVHRRNCVGQMISATTSCWSNSRPAALSTSGSNPP